MTGTSTFCGESTQTILLIVYTYKYTHEYPCAYVHTYIKMYAYTCILAHNHTHIGI